MWFLSTQLVSDMTTGLTNFGTELLTYFVQILPALAGIAAILFIINIVRNKVNS